MLGSAINNVHEDCPDEQLIIGTKCADFAEKMAEAIAARVEQLVRMLCNKVGCGWCFAAPVGFGNVASGGGGVWRLALLPAAVRVNVSDAVLDCRVRTLLQRTEKASETLSATMG